jgi:orotate phosphoribosyltransferase
MVGAEAVAFALARESLDQGSLINAFIVRKEPKPHGMQKLLKASILPNVAGWSLLTTFALKVDPRRLAITNARSAGMIVIGAVCLVDREMGATELLAQRGVELTSIFKLSDLREGIRPTRRTRARRASALVMGVRGIVGSN